MKKPRRTFHRGDGSKDRYYFSTKEEQAIIKYVKVKGEEREKIYTEIIYPALVKLIDSVVNVYKFHYLPNLGDLKKICLQKMTLSLEKYDGNRSSKAFSYFTVSVKNFFIAEVKRNQDDRKKKVMMKEVIESGQLYEKDFIGESFERFELVESWVDKFEKNGKMTRKNSNYYKAYKVIKDILEDPMKIEEKGINIDKESIYQYIMDEVGINKNQLVSIIYRMKKKILEDNAK